MKERLVVLIMMFTLAFTYMPMFSYANSDDCDLGHDVDTVVVNARCGEYGYYYNMCKRCGKYLDSSGVNTVDNLDAAKYNVTSPKVALGTKCEMEWKVEKYPTETEQGIKAYECNMCGFIECRMSIARGHMHIMTYIPAKQATMTEEGNIAYWFCESCKKYFEDEYGDGDPISLSETIIPKLSDGSFEEGSSTDVQSEKSDKQVADEVTSAIVSLPETITLEEADAIEAANKAYNDLTSGQKALVDVLAVAKLEQANSIISNWKTYYAAVGKAATTICNSFSLKAKTKKKITITFISVSNDTIYQVRYSLDKSFKKHVKKASVMAGQKTITLNKLKANKTYYIQIKPIKFIKNDVTGEVSGIAGKWSKAKKIKTKK